MNCPNCQTPCAEGDRFCYQCGTPLAGTPVKKGTHWIPALILVLMSALGILVYFAVDIPTPAATEPYLSDAPWFAMYDGELYFDPYYYDGGSELTVPAEIDGQTVYSLGFDCFYECDMLTGIILPDTLLTIGDEAFFECTGLRGMFIPESVTYIGEQAFFCCESLEAICIPASVEEIGKFAFFGCYDLRYVFYDGTFDDWQALYDGYIAEDTAVICEDGTFYQGGSPW